MSARPGARERDLARRPVSEACTPRAARLRGQRRSDEPLDPRSDLLRDMDDPDGTRDGQPSRVLRPDRTPADQHLHPGWRCRVALPGTGLSSPRKLLREPPGVRRARARRRRFRPQRGYRLPGDGRRLRAHRAVDRAPRFDERDRGLDSRDVLDGADRDHDLLGRPAPARLNRLDEAVAFNVAWHACLARQPATCGELRALAAAGGRLLRGTGDVAAGWQFSGNHPSSMFSIPADQYNALWLRWGMLGRPSDFDQLAAERYGTPLSAERNPYPLPGEDPNLTDGGSGQLPMALTQTHNADGSWSGNIGVTCSICHSGQIGAAADGPGLGALFGNNGLADVNLLLTELGNANNGFNVMSLNRVRGSGNITNFQLFGLLTLFDFQTTLPAMVLNPGLWTSSNTGSEDPPNWWNLGHRPAKFFDAGMSTDSTRIELSWYMPGAATPQYQEGYDWVLAHEYAGNTWMLSLRSPAYPLPIDTRLAKRGAALFHRLDLWATGRHNPVPRPVGGNGSCASCHGAYAPRYVNNPRFLATPMLAGMAGNVTPDRKSTRLNSSHSSISYAVFCLKKKKLQRELRFVLNRPGCRDLDAAAQRVDHLEARLICAVHQGERDARGDLRLLAVRGDGPTL